MRAITPGQPSMGEYKSEEEYLAALKRWRKRRVHFAKIEEEMEGLDDLPRRVDIEITKEENRFRFENLGGEL